MMSLIISSKYTAWYTIVKDFKSNVDWLNGAYNFIYLLVTV